MACHTLFCTLFFLHSFYSLTHNFKDRYLFDLYSFSTCLYYWCNILLIEYGLQSFCLCYSINTAR